MLSASTESAQIHWYFPVHADFGPFIHCLWILERLLARFKKLSMLVPPLQTNRCHPLPLASYHVERRMHCRILRVLRLDSYQVNPNGHFLHSLLPVLHSLKTPARKRRSPSSTSRSEQKESS